MCLMLEERIDNLMFLKNVRNSFYGFRISLSIEDEFVEEFKG